MFFDEIAHNYDLINSIISFGLDNYWRKRMIKEIDGHPRHILEIGAGTGKMLTLLRDRFFMSHIVALEPSRQMVKYAPLKLTPLYQLQSLQEFAQSSKQKFDLIVLAFVLRNLPIEESLQQMQSLLAPQGSIFILEFHKVLLSFPPKLYFNSFVLPYWAKMWGGKIKNYRHLIKITRAYLTMDIQKIFSRYFTVKRKQCFLANIWQLTHLKEQD